jgi:hypothetical protein
MCGIFQGWNFTCSRALLIHAAAPKVIDLRPLTIATCHNVYRVTRVEGDPNLPLSRPPGF